MTGDNIDIFKHLHAAVGHVEKQPPEQRQEQHFDNQHNRQVPQQRISPDAFSSRRTHVRSVHRLPAELTELFIVRKKRSVVERLLDAYRTTQIAGLVTDSPVIRIQALQLNAQRLCDLLGAAVADETLRRHTDGFHESQ